MTLPTSPPDAGWHLNANGQRQWWDGASWGPLAPEQLPMSHSIAPAGFLIPAKTRTAAYWLLILLGGFGAHRFYLRHPGTASMLLVASFVQVLFRLDPDPASAIVANVILALVWLWIIVDLFTVPSMVDNANRKTMRGLRH
ncbi:hypothetical protein GCM10010458_36780 [Microbacterium luteolum]|uniref:TM2 domain-containing protein n=1 Tax=Microbacterium luteolum TaxID=69367 RepID=A0ABY7XK96_MICLT|nr:TM2 domain-containing protein [Microbacterium luteolum]WDM42541.1 TM2 domain-containing protein [Microbacterium luteolum]